MFQQVSSHNWKTKIGNDTFYLREFQPNRFILSIKGDTAFIEEFENMSYAEERAQEIAAQGTNWNKQMLTIVDGFKSIRNGAKCKNAITGAFCMACEMTKTLNNDQEIFLVKKELQNLYFQILD